MAPSRDGRMILQLRCLSVAALNGMTISLYSLNSDGAGRSGVYLAIDANIELSEEDGVFDVYGYLKKMRQQRRGLVESLVSEALRNCGKTSSVEMRRTTA